MGCGASSSKKAENLKEVSEPIQTPRLSTTEEQQQQTNQLEDINVEEENNNNNNSETTTEQVVEKVEHVQQQQQQQEQEELTERQQLEDDNKVIESVDDTVNELLQEEKENANTPRANSETNHHNNTTTDNNNNNNESTEKVGHLFLVLGPSGVGKDTLMNGARKAIGEDHPNYYFVQRYITRPLSENPNDEKHVPLSDEEFDDKRDRDEFCLHWAAHNLKYGIDSATVNRELQLGKNVIVNVSRGVIQQAQNLFVQSHVTVIEINADSNVIRDRLIKRGRESRDDIEERVRRGEEMSKAVEQVAHHLKRVLNNTTIDEGIDRLLVALQFLPDDSLYD